MIIPGTEVVLALWGSGFTSPVHGHAQGYIHEDLLSGRFDVHLYDRVGSEEERKAVYKRTIPQSEPGIFYSAYVQDNGQAKRSALIHNFRAVEPSFSLHYLPEHVRDGDANRFKVVKTSESGPLPEYIKTRDFRSGLKINAGDVLRVSQEKVAKDHKVGDVYLVRSNNVAFLGDHYVLIMGGMIEKPHGVRPKDLSIQIPDGENSLLDNYRPGEELVILELNDQARSTFYDHYEIEEDLRR